MVPRSRAATQDEAVAEYLRQRRGLPGDGVERQRQRRIREYLCGLPPTPRRAA